MLTGLVFARTYPAGGAAGDALEVGGADAVGDGDGLVVGCVVGDGGGEVGVWFGVAVGDGVGVGVGVGVETVPDGLEETLG